MEHALQPIVDILGRLLPFEWAAPEFMRMALLAVLLACPLCATVGVLVVNRQMAFFSEAIAHSAFTGIGIGLLIGVGGPLPWMVLFCVLVGLGIAVVRERSPLAIDTVIGVFFAVVISVGLVIISALQGLARLLPGYLFGDILTVGPNEVGMLAFLAALTAIFLGFGFNPLTLSSISPETAASRGVPLRFYEYGFAILLSLIVALSIRVTGILLITALFVVPAAAARNLAGTLRQFFWLSALIAAFSGVTGLIASFYLNTATGASIILVAALCFTLTFIIRRAFMKS